jgi:hypothetical protein
MYVQTFHGLQLVANHCVPSIQRFGLAGHMGLKEEVSQLTSFHSKINAQQYTLNGHSSFCNKLIMRNAVNVYQRKMALSRLLREAMFFFVAVVL